MTRYININGKILEETEFSVSAKNRSYLYGDGVFESIRIKDGKILNLNAHIERAIAGAKAIKINIPASYTLDYFEEEISELLRWSGITEGGKIRLSIDREIGGTYRPANNDATFVIECNPLENNNFELNSKGYDIDLYTDLKKQKNRLSNFKTKNGLIYIMASLAAQEKGLDDYLITNERGGILEGSSSNLFVVSNGVLYTPGLEEGCLGGTMRMRIINIALSKGIKVYECNIMPQNLLAADEIFLTNAISGVIWVAGYRTKRYYNNVARQFIDYLNEAE